MENERLKFASEILPQTLISSFFQKLAYLLRFFASLQNRVFNSSKVETFELLKFKENTKCVMILDETLPRGILANAAAILGITLGKNLPAIVGQNVADKDGNKHEGIITFPVSVLAGRKELIKSLRQKLFGADFSDIVTVDFSDVAQGCKTYSEYIDKMADTGESELAYFGIALCGDKKKINRLTGNLPLLK